MSANDKTDEIAKTVFHQLKLLVALYASHAVSDDCDDDELFETVRESLRKIKGKIGGLLDSLEPRQ